MLDSEIGKLDAEIAQNEEMRTLKSVELALGQIVNNVESKEAAVNEAIATKKAWANSLIDIASEEIERASNGNLAVERYTQRAKADQDVYIFDHTHWKLLMPQMYKDFVNACAQKIGLPENIVKQPAFMNRLYETVAFRAAHARNRYEPKGTVSINMQNGTLVLKQGEDVKLRPHDSGDFFLYALPYPYMPDAECPLFHKFLDEVLPEEEAQDLLGEYIGYCMTKNIKCEKMLALYGYGSNGKSVLLDIIEMLFGHDNVSNVSLQELTEDAERLSMIENKMVNISHESDRELNASKLKMLVSHEPVVVRELYIGSHTMYDYANLITSFNILPMAENTHGFYRRFIIVPFNVTITKEKADVNLSKKLAEELPGILNWVLEGLKRLISNGYAFTESKLCNDALQRYILSSDNVRLFINEQCEMESVYPTQGKVLYDKYRLYCYNEGLRSSGKSKFYERLESLGAIRTDPQRIPMFNIKVLEG